MNNDVAAWKRLRTLRIIEVALVLPAVAALLLVPSYGVGLALGVLMVLFVVSVGVYIARLRFVCPACGKRFHRTTGLGALRSQIGRQSCNSCGAKPA